MTAFKVGDVVSVEFPFSDLQTHKRRPGLVLVSGDVDLLVARITYPFSTRSLRRGFPALVRNWFAARFNHPSDETRHD